jgi:LPS-assembly protein
MIHPPKPVFFRLAAIGAVLVLVPAGDPLFAQSLQVPTTTQPAPDTPIPENDEQIGFASDQLEYDDNAQVVTATGNVQLLREGNRLRADRVIWHRTTGKVEATGNVSVTDAEGNIAYGDRFDVTDTLKDGVVENMLIVLQQGGRLAANRGTRTNGIYTLEHAAYSPCTVEGGDGCPKEPTWQIRAVRVIYNPERQRVTYKGARIEFFGLPLIPLPGLSHPVGEGGGSGLLVPSIRYDRVNGAEITLPYYLKLAPNSDFTFTPHLYSDALPMAEATYRVLHDKGAYQVTGYATYGTRTSANTEVTPTSKRDFRGYFDASGAYQLDPNWSLSSSIRLTTDRTFLRRYDISRDDRLRSTIQAERTDDNSYLSIAGWAVQTLRGNDPQGQVPIALPVIDYRRRIADPLLGGQLQLQANSLAITRTQGQDTQRAFAGVQWDLRKLTGMGQEVTFTTYLRGDVYHTGDTDLTSTISYRGAEGWHARGIAAAAVDVRWPLIGPAFGGTQRITPRVQIVAAPKLSNLSIPNEDSRAIDLDDSNLFALNRFSGYDRFEDSTRVTYGLEYGVERKNLSVNAVIGQSYRLVDRPTLFPDGTGLTSRTSDIVGRTTIRYKNFLTFTHRYRLDKDNLAIRRNEADATIGSNKTYLLVGYLRLNRDSALNLEDLRDREEIRLGGRVQFARFWSAFGSTVIDLTGKQEDPTSAADGYQPVVHRLGISYQDDCLEFGLTWRRNYRDTGDARSGNSFLLRLAFRNLGI